MLLGYNLGAIGSDLYFGGVSIISSEPCPPPGIILSVLVWALPIIPLVIAGAAVIIVLLLINKIL